MILEYRAIEEDRPGHLFLNVNGKRETFSTISREFQAIEIAEGATFHGSMVEMRIRREV